MMKILTIIVFIIYTSTVVKSSNINHNFLKNLSKQKNKIISFLSASIIFNNPLISNAGMLTLPLQAPLHNNLFLVRAGSSFADERNEIQTNPVKKLRMDNGLTPKGQEEARGNNQNNIFNFLLLLYDSSQAAAKKLLDMGVTPTFIWTSNTERAYETAKVMAQELQLGQNRIVPEYSFLDARAMGIYEGTNMKTAYENIHEEDVKSIKYRPPPNNDGTPAESVDDVYVRSNQLVATIESMYSGENVIIVSPDSDNLSILTSAVIDENPDQSLPLHSRFSFLNGEVRKLNPIIVPSKLLVTGQTPEEAENYNLKMMAAKVKGRETSLIEEPKTYLDLLKLVSI